MYARLLTVIGVVGLLAVAGPGCRNGSGSSESTPPQPSVGPPGATLDGQPVRGLLTLENLRSARELRIHGPTGWACRLELIPPRYARLRYFDLPGYPNAVGARQLNPAVESATEDRSGCEVSLVTTDELPTVAAWYGKRLSGWRRIDLGRGEAGPESGAGELGGVIFRQEPEGRRRVLLDALPVVGAVLIGYEVLPEDAPLPSRASKSAARKEQDVLVLTLAAEGYRHDTGLDVESVGQLTAASGPKGYKGPYLDRAPSDPYSGEPYVIRKGKVAGPGDVRDFGS